MRLQKVEKPSYQTLYKIKKADNDPAKITCLFFKFKLQLELFWRDKGTAFQNKNIVISGNITIRIKFNSSRSTIKRNTWKHSFYFTTTTSTFTNSNRNSFQSVICLRSKWARSFSIGFFMPFSKKSCSRTYRSKCCLCSACKSSIIKRFRFCFSTR